MARYKKWQEKFPNYLVIGHESGRFSAYGKCAKYFAKLINSSKVVINGRTPSKSSRISEVKLLSLLSECEYKYVIYNSKTFKIEHINQDGKDFVSASRVTLDTIEFTNNVIECILALEDGINPETGELFSEDSFVFSQMAKKILSLAKNYIYLHAQQSENIEKREIIKSTFIEYKEKLFDNGLVCAYERWTKEEEKQLVSEFNNKESLKEIAGKHMRTIGAIRARLIKLGLIDDTFARAELIEVNTEKDNKSFIDTVIGKDESIIHRAENCKLYKNETCGGAGCSSCNDFEPLITIPQEEIDLWPKYGDAIAIASGDFERFKDDK